MLFAQPLSIQFQDWGHFPAWHLYSKNEVRTPIAVVADTMGGNRNKCRALIAEHIVDCWNSAAKPGLLQLQDQVTTWALKNGRLPSEEERLNAIAIRLRDLRENPRDAGILANMLLLLCYHADCANLNLLECALMHFEEMQAEAAAKKVEVAK